MTDADSTSTSIAVAVLCGWGFIYVLGKCIDDYRDKDWVTFWVLTVLALFLGGMSLLAVSVLVTFWAPISNPFLLITASVLLPVAMLLFIVVNFLLFGIGSDVEKKWVRREKICERYFQIPSIILGPGCMALFLVWILLERWIIKFIDKAMFDLVGTTIAWCFFSVFVLGGIFLAYYLFSKWIIEKIHPTTMDPML